MTEEWKQIPKFYGEYEMCNDGRLRRMTTVKGFKKGRLRAVQNAGHGYPCYIMVCQDGIQRTMYIHRMLATLFIPNPLSLPEINHKDGNIKNYSLDNIEWVTRVQNMQHKIHVLHKGIGESHSQAVVNEDQVREIRARCLSGEYQDKIAADFGISQTAVSLIHRRINWSHVA